MAKKSTSKKLAILGIAAGVGMFAFAPMVAGLTLTALAVNHDVRIGEHKIKPLPGVQMLFSGEAPPIN